MIDKILSFLAPHHCYGCGQIDGILCDNCKYNIISEPFINCIGCQRPTVRYGLCRTCRLPYKQAWVVDKYHSSLGEAIKGMKIVGVREAATVLGRILADSLPTLPSNVAIVPVPTIRSHIRQRGFDHTYILAQTVAKQLCLPVARVIVRIDHSAQRGATAKQRRAQAKKAFMVKGDLDPSLIYLVIDDVVTTSATIREVGHQLRQAGAKELWVAALTRETLD